MSEVFGISKLPTFREKQVQPAKPFENSGVRPMPVEFDDSHLRRLPGLRRSSFC